MDGKRDTMRTAAAIGALMALAACGINTTERAATAGAGGAVAGALVGGPLGAVVGAAGGAAAGSTLDQDAGKTAREWMDDDGSAGKPRMGSGAAIAPERVRSVQEALNGQGAGLTVDGYWGPKTRAALENYQRQNNLPVTGRLDNETVARLGLPGAPNAPQSGSSGNQGSSGGSTDPNVPAGSGSSMDTSPPAGSGSSEPPAAQPAVPDNQPVIQPTPPENQPAPMPDTPPPGP
jgi:peptidoglycan hydrolase-like protein with peptidoglycan-binding domain